MPSQPAHSSITPRRLGPWLVRGVSGAWALAWTGFAVASAIGNTWQSYALALALGAAVWAPTLIAWGRPRLGGLLLLALGIWAFDFFHSRAAMLGLALPAVLIGSAFVMLGVWAAWRRRRARRRAASQPALRES